MNHKTWMHHARAWLTASVLALGAVAALAQGRIESVSGSVVGGQEVLRVELSQPLAAPPTGFAIQSPARIALDFPGYANGVGRSQVEVNQGNLRSVGVVQAGERTRLIVNLKQSTTYSAQLQGNAVLITLDPVVAAAPPVTQTFAENRNPDVLPLRGIDFRRGADGVGRVVVDLANNQVGVDIKQQGANLVVEFAKTSLPENLRRRFDVTDFGTPVQNISAFPVGERVRMLIEPRGLWEHSAYQTESQFVVEVRAQKVDPGKLTQGPGYSGEKLSLNFQNIDIRQLLQVIADFTNFNVITSDAVSGSVTMRLKDVPWDQALDIILQTKNLGVRKTGNVLLIAPKDELIAKERQELEARASTQNLEPLRSQSFQLNYTKAEALAQQLLSTGGQQNVGVGASANSNRILSPRGSVIPEKRTNQIFVTDIASRLEAVAQLIAKLDIPVRQVLIEARIVEAQDTFGKSLGVRFGIQDFSANTDPASRGFGLAGSGRFVVGTDLPNAVASSLQGVAAGGNATLNTASNFVNLPAIGQNGFSPGSVALSIFSPRVNRYLNLELSALEADGRGKIVSSPRVVTADQTLARIEQGTEIPYQVAAASGATAIAFRRATLKLEVTPQITPEGGIILDLEVNKDSVGAPTAAGPSINTKQIKTQVLVENGGTVVIGGIFELTDNDAETRVPFFGDLPVVGNLFKNKSRTFNKSEILVFITPKVISERTSVR